MSRLLYPAQTVVETLTDEQVNRELQRRPLPPSLSMDAPMQDKRAWLKTRGEMPLTGALFALHLFHTPTPSHATPSCNLAE